MSRRRVLGLLGMISLAPLGACKSQTTVPRSRASDADESLHYLSLQEVGRRIAIRELSPVALTKHMLQRIASIDGLCKSYATVMADTALAQAQVAEQEINAGAYRGPLHGVPLAVKDLCYTKGVRTMGGSGALRTFVPDVDATVVARLHEAGAVVLGKLNLTEGAMAGYHPDFDVPLNPWDRSRWPGLSSSGSGVATAAGLCFAAIGTDTGGSIRFPSSANGVVGLKPTYGRVSRFGVLPFAESLDHVGPMARRVADVAVMFEAIAGHDPRDPTSLRDPVPEVTAQLGQGIASLRIGIDRRFALEGIDAGQAASIEEALQVLSRLGARVVDVCMPDLKGVPDAWFILAASEAAAAHAARYPSHASEYGPYIRDFLNIGAGMTELQINDAKAVRAQFTAQLTALLDTVDAMAMPAGGSPAWPITHELQVGRMAPLSAAWEAALPRFPEFTSTLNLAGTPSVCVPSGFSPDGLPYSIQFAGGRLSEALLCRIGYAYENAAGWYTRHPKFDGA